MGRAWNIVAVCIIIIFAIWMQRVSVEVLGPGTPMWNMVADIQYGTLNGREWAEETYVAVTVWVPWMIVIAAIAGAFVQEFRRENVTAAQVGGPRR